MAAAPHLPDDFFESNAAELRHTVIRTENARGVAKKYLLSIAITAKQTLRPK
jgi:hypothetical protein